MNNTRHIARYSLNSNIAIIILPTLETNYVFIIRDESTNYTAIIDPGEAKPVSDFLAEQNWKPNEIIITHHHWDHTNGITKLVEEFKCAVVGFEEDAHRIPHISTQLKSGEIYQAGPLALTAHHHPGHTLGAISYYCDEHQIAFVGDTLFAMGCGRLFEGTAQQLYDSLQSMCSWPNETLIFCAHEYTLDNAKFALTIEPSNDQLQERLKEAASKAKKNEPTVPTMLKLEKATNPFLRCHLPHIKKHLAIEGADDVTSLAKIRSLKDEF